MDQTAHGCEILSVSLELQDCVALESIFFRKLGDEAWVYVYGPEIKFHKFSLCAKNMSDPESRRWLFLTWMELC